MESGPLTKANSRQTRIEKSLRRLERQRQKAAQKSRFVSWLRLGYFLLSFLLVIAMILLRHESLAWFFLGSGVFGFTLLVRWHQGIRLSLYRHTLALQFQQEDLARLDLNWDKLPAWEEDGAWENHPFAKDLDIIGERSIFRLINTTLTQEGQNLLKSKLLQREPQWERLLQERTRVQELTSRPTFRSGLRLAAYQAAGEYRHQRHEKSGWSTTALLDFLNQYQPKPNLTSVLILLGILACVNILLYGLFYLGVLPAWTWQTSLTAYILLFFQQKHQIQGLFQEAFHLDFQLYKLQAVLRFIEETSFQYTPALRELCHPFFTQEQRPSKLIKKLKQVVSASSLQANPVAWALANLLGPWDYFFAWRLNQLKPKFQTALPQWLGVLAELESLSALAHFAWLHPEYHWPDLRDPAQTDTNNKSSTPQFITQAIGHPLIPNNQKIHNDFQLQSLGQAFIITGSNMAGKSTFLKSLGINLVLAYAGTVVDAQVFSCGLYRLYTCIKVSDSVTDGLSYFYAEVKRLKGLLQALEAQTETPLFFLIDEIFKGTNNRERLIGSRSYIQALTGRNGMGGISTHDLELVKLAETNPLISNYHFREEIKEQKMYFDYRLRLGPCPTTNALRIMAFEGLPIENNELA